MSDSAFRTLQALAHLSFRFEPEKSKWVHPGRSFTRGEIEAECGLSGQGTRNGLSELEDEGYVSVDRSGRSYEYTLEMEVPTSNFTYLPTSLLEANGFSGTELRVLFTVLRATWGWTTSSNSSTGNGEPEHRRWAQLSTSDLAKRTGRSKSAVKSAVKALCGTLLDRRRPQGGAYYYRVLEEGLLGLEAGPEERSQEEKPAVQVKKKRFFSVGIPNDLPMGRQRSAPPSSYKESYFERKTKHSACGKRRGRNQNRSARRSGKSAVREPQSSNSRKQDRRKEPHSKQSSHRGPSSEASPSGEDIDLTGFSESKRALGQKLANVGVWPRRIPELLGRYSAERIEANFQLYRKRAQNIENGGAWLAAAIEEGFALPSRPETSSGPDAGAPALPEPGTKVTDTRKRELIRTSKASGDDFDRFAEYDDPRKKQHIYQAEKRPSPAARG